MTPALETTTDTSDRSAAADAADSETGGDRNWWRQAVVYQIYPRSFADANGDGIGDLPGIISRVDHLRRLGVDAVWLSPFYPSALADGGYDVDDYRAVAPELGPSTTSTPWSPPCTRPASSSSSTSCPTTHRTGTPGSARRSRPHPGRRPAAATSSAAAGAPTGPSRPPTGPRSFGGSAWAPLGDGDWYLHLFAPEQPDLNWAEEEVREDFLTTLRFWADRGVDGFRGRRRTPARQGRLGHQWARRLAALPGADLRGRLRRRRAPVRRPRRRARDLPVVARRLQRVRPAPDGGRRGVGPRAPAGAVRVAGGARAGVQLRPAPDRVGRRRLPEGHRRHLALAREAGASSTWVFSNHDMVRHATRYALPNGTDLVAWLRDGGTDPAPDGPRGLRKARAATLLALALPGSAYLYQGEELGLPEVTDLPVAVLQDPTFLRSGGSEKGRDGCRVPIPWRASGESFGFGPGSAHLPQPAWFGRYSVESELADPDSTLQLYIAALADRRSLLAAEELTWRESPAAVVAFERPGGWVSMTNFGDTGVPLPEGRVVITSEPLAGDELPPETTVWLHTETSS